MQEPDLERRNLPTIPYVTPFTAIAPIALSYFIGAAFSIALTGVAGTLASFWAATGILLVALLRRPTREWPFIAVVIWLVDICTNLVLGSPIGLGAGIAAVDVLEGLAGAALILRLLGGADPLDPRFLLYSFLAIMVAAFGAATLGSVWLLLMDGTSFRDTWTVWFLADFLGTTTVAAALFVWTDAHFIRRQGSRFWAELVMWTLITVAAAYATFRVDQPFLFILFPPILLATFRGGLLGGTASTLVVAGFSLWFTIQGQGPIAAAVVGATAAIEVVQVFIAVVFLSTFPLAVVLEQDRKLKGELQLAGEVANEARHQAEIAANAKTEFLASMSHEIRTPLNSIIGFTDVLLEDHTLDQRQRRQIGLVHNSGNALLSVINDILDFSKIEAGKIDLHTEPFATEALIDNSVSITRGSAEAKGLDLRVVQDPKLGKYYVGDEHRLRQVLLNLLNNAIKFTPAGEVTLSVMMQRSVGNVDTMRFAITDTGEGVAEDKQHRLFQSFSQADNTVTRRHGGTGLGLAISKRLIEAMGGNIGVGSKEGEGSTFWFTVTLTTAAALPQPDREAQTVDVIRSARILLVEDVPVNQELACAILRKDGHEVDTADDGQAAVEAARGGIYDLILMDIQMPKVDGITATKMIRELPGAAGKVPIIAMTANVLAEQIKHFIEAGMDDHVAKPIKQVELKTAINRALNMNEVDSADQEPR